MLSGITTVSFGVGAHTTGHAKIRNAKRPREARHRQTGPTPRGLNAPSTDPFVLIASGKPPNFVVYQLRKHLQSQPDIPRRIWPNIIQGLKTIMTLHDMPTRRLKALNDLYIRLGLIAQ